MSWGWWKGISLLCTFHGGGEYLHRPVSLSLSFCLGSMLGTLVCSSLRSRQAYWAAPSTTQCDALLPLRFTPLSPLLFLCRGLMLSMSSTSTCDTAARRGLPPPGSLVFQDVSLPVSWTKAHAPDQHLSGLQTARVPQTGRAEGGVRAAQPDGSLYCVKKLLIVLEPSCFFPVGMSSTN